MTGQRRPAFLIVPIFILSSIIISIAILAVSARYPAGTNPQPHNCRMWGITAASMPYGLQSIVREHLDSLRSLGYSNRDGWGITFFTAAGTDSFMPLIERGEPCAPADPRYAMAVNDLIAFMKTTGIAHVRNRSSGPTNIPNPHPFFRKSLHRDLNLLFSHNGSVATNTLMDLIQHENHGYIDSNPPDYPYPDYLDSDLYFLFIVEMLDTYLSESIEKCVQLAITKIDSALGPARGTAQFNFLMTDGHTLWALRYAMSAPDYYSLYYYPALAGIQPSDYWIAASQPLDDQSAFWREIPNSCLATFKPGALPLFTYINGSPACTCSIPVSAAIAPQQNPASGRVAFAYRLELPARIRITIYNGAGALVKTLFDDQLPPGDHTALWTGDDERGNVVPSGTYFLHFDRDGSVTTTKTIFLRR